jgi:diguanylate cyclase (GGDEF)-like protein
MIDLDHFKKVNDQEGHLAGNVVLQAIASILKDNLRPMDTVARFGGEEFAMILPNSSSDKGKKVAERLRDMIANTKIPIKEKTTVRVTVSIGIASTIPGRPMEPRTLVSIADKNLYHAKDLGRNRIWFEIPPPSSITGDEKSALFTKMRK